MGGAEFLTAHLPAVITATTDLVKTDDDYQHRVVMRIIEQLLIRYPKEVAHLLHPLYENLFIYLLKETPVVEDNVCIILPLLTV